MINVAVVDDERPARSELIFLLTSVLEEVKCYEADSAAAAMQLLKEEKFAAIFLDISLGDVKGTVLASVIRETQPQAGIVFVTAYQDYAAEAFDLDAVDYVMKPFDLKRLEKAVDKLRIQGFLNESRELGELTQGEKTQVEYDKLPIHAGDCIRLVDVQDIVLVETSQRGCLIHTKQQTYEENVTMNHLEEKLSEKNFYRVHKSYLVNLNYVKELIPSYNSGYAMKLSYYPEISVPISRAQVKNIRKIFSIQ